MNKFLKNTIRDGRYGFIIAIVVFTLSYIGWFSANEIVDNQIKREFSLISREIVHEVEDRMEVYSNILSGGKGLYEASEFVSREEFSQFIISQDILKKNPGIQALEYIERVSREEKNEFIQRIRDQGFKNFNIKPEGDRAHYLVVNYIEPLIGNEFGFDLASNKDLLDALEKSRNIGEFIITAPTQLVQDAGNTSAFLAFLPIYNKFGYTDTLEERRDNLEGFFLAVVKPDNLFANFTADDLVFKGINFSLRDEKNVFFRSDIDVEDTKDYKFFFRSDIHVGGRIWKFEAHATNTFIQFFDTEKILPHAILVSGLLFGILLFIILLLISRTKRKATELAHEMTGSFNTEKIKVENINKKLTIALDKVKISLVKGGSQQKAIFNILEDVKEEKAKVEHLASDLKKFELAVENASDHIVITDKEGIILYVNKTAENITGFSRKEVLGKKAGTIKLWGGHMSINFYKKLWKTIKKDKKVFTSDINNVRKNGQEYVASASISPILDNNGEVKFFVGIERDITKEREVDRAKTEFVSLASHQLRTPLSTINWYVEMILAGDVGKLSKGQKDYLKEVYTANQRMVTLVNLLLNVSRIEMGTFMISPEETDIVKLAKLSLDASKMDIGKKKLAVKSNYDKALPLVNTDPKLLSIVFDNLISNAVKYTPEGGKIEININKKDKNMEFSIHDNGMGIPKEQQHNIFTKLFRADNVRKSDTEGTGLGLYIAKSIVEHSGGKIWFTSEKDKGTTFNVCLPLAGMKKKVGTKSLGGKV